MAYATQTDILTIYSDEALLAAEHDGVIDVDAVARALSSASDEIDSYLGVRYAVPWAENSGLLVQWCVDIALYRLAQTRDYLTEELRTRYEDVRAHLVRVSNGTAVLPAAPNDDPDADPQFDAPKPIVQSGPPKLFTRALTRDL